MRYIRRIICACYIFIIANIPFLYEQIFIPNEWNWIWVLPLILGFLVLLILPTISNRFRPERRLRICAYGCELLFYFIISVTGSIVYNSVMIMHLIRDQKMNWIGNLICMIIVEFLVFLCGIIRIYFTSIQLGIKWRIIGIACGWIPFVQIFVLLKLVQKANDECKFETEKAKKNKKRSKDKICKTKYPLLFVHGVFFRDYKYLNYWGRIPKELESNGAIIYYGEHQSAASIQNSGKELANRIEQLVEKTGCQKVNVIAHSKGGLDIRYAVSHLGIDKYVASLTTINTPHKGCMFADYLLEKIPKVVVNKVAITYNQTLKKLGDSNPDFIAAVSDLTASACEKFNQDVKNVEEIYYQSIGSKLNKASGGRFPLNFSHHLVKHFDGPNDGLVAESSFGWGEEYTLLTVNGNRGISHGDMIDLNRENFEGFDVREFYVELVHKLKEKGF